MTQKTSTAPTSLAEASSASTPGSETQLKLAKAIYPYSHSPWPVWSLSALFLGSSVTGLSIPALPPFPLRFAFGLIFTGAGYVLSTGDIKNGSGIATAWSSIYLISNQLRKTGLKRDVASGTRALPRHPLSMVFAGATLLSTALYGSEYFWFENFEEPPE